MSPSTPLVHRLAPLALGIGAALFAASALWSMQQHARFVETMFAVLQSVWG